MKKDIVDITIDMKINTLDPGNWTHYRQKLAALLEQEDPNKIYRYFVIIDKYTYRIDKNGKIIEKIIPKEIK